jgi:hypothetical protein
MPQDACVVEFESLVGWSKFMELVTKFWRLDVMEELYSGYGKGYLWRKRSTKAIRELNIPDGTDAMRSLFESGQNGDMSDD